MIFESMQLAEINWEAIGVVLVGLGIIFAAIWWVISSIFSFQTKLADLGQKYLTIQKELDEHKQADDDRYKALEVWLKETAELLHKVDKQTAALAVKQGVNV